MEKMQPFCQVVSASVAVMIGAPDMSIPGQLEGDDLLKLRDETGFEIWRNSVKQAIQYAFDSIKRHCKPSSDLVGELEDRIEQARSAVLKSCRSSAFLRKVMSRGAYIENGFGGAFIADADLPPTDLSRKEDIGFTSLVDFFGTNPVPGQRVLLKHFSFFEPNDEHRCIG